MVNKNNEAQCDKIYRCFYEAVHLRIFVCFFSLAHSLSLKRKSALRVQAFFSWEQLFNRCLGFDFLTVVNKCNFAFPVV